MTDDEQPMSGGNSTAVVRIGGAVHRTTGPWTPAVHALLRTLRAAGVHDVPEPLGFDTQGREVLTFLPGDVANHPLPAWLWEPAILDDAARLLRRLHDASVSLVAEGLTWGMQRKEPAEVICHNDFAPYNMTFAEARVTGVFDFDMAAPGPRIRDLAYLQRTPRCTAATPCAPPTSPRLPRDEDATAGGVPRGPEDDDWICRLSD